jgi:hypothetical protein
MPQDETLHWHWHCFGFQASSTSLAGIGDTGGDAYDTLGFGNLRDPEVERKVS